MTNRDPRTDIRAQEERQSVLARLRQVDLTLDRRKEKQTLYGWLDSFAHNQSHLLAIEGRSGIGKSQFLKKAARRCHHRNILLVSTDARKTTGPFGVFRLWLEEIQGSDLPTSVAQELSAFVSTRRLLALLCGQTNDLPAKAEWRLPAQGSGNDQMAQLTVDLVRFFTIVSRYRPLLLAISNYDALDHETETLIHRVLIGLASSKIGFILTAEPVSLRIDRLPSSLDVTRLEIAPLNSPQVQGLIRQICKRHHLSEAFIGQLSDHTDGNAAELLLTLWYLIETGYVAYTKTGWFASTQVPWASLPVDLNHEIALRLVALAPDAGSLIKGMAAAGHLLDLPSLLRVMGWDRKRFAGVSEEINRTFPVFVGNDPEQKSVISTAILKSVREGCISESERGFWCHRLAGFLADSGAATIHQEIAEIYEEGGRGESALTYRIAAAHRAKSVACYDRAALNLERGLQHCKQENGLRARLLIRLADIQIFRGNNSESRACVESAIRIAKKTGSLKLEADAKFLLSGVEISEGSLAEGLAMLDQSLALYKAAGREDGQLGALGRMATVYRELRMWPQSDAINDEMLALAELENDPTRVVASRINAAISSAVRGERSRAAEHLYHALRVCRKNGQWDLVTFALIDFADAIGQGSDSKNLDRYYVAAIASARRRFDEIRELEATHKLAIYYVSSGAYQQAGAAADQVIRLAELRGDAFYKGEAMRIAGICAWKQGISEAAVRLFSQVIEIAETTRDEGMKARVLADKGDWALAKSPDLAEAAWREARDIFCRLDENDEVLRLDRSLIRFAYEHARPPARYSRAV